MDVVAGVSGHNPLPAPGTGTDTSVIGEYRKAIARLQIPDTKGMIVRARDSMRFCKEPQTAMSDCSRQ